MAQTDNPLLGAFSAPFGLPPFSDTHAEHFTPALDLARRESLAEIDAIADSTAAPTFANTIDALEL